jgi:hypothetical protein
MLMLTPLAAKIHRKWLFRDGSQLSGRELNLAASDFDGSHLNIDAGANGDGGHVKV